MRAINLKKPLKEYTVEEVTSASQILVRTRTLLYSKMGAGVCKVLSPPGALAEDMKTYDEDPAKNYVNGYKDGLEAGIRCFPNSTNDFSLEELLAAVYGEDKPTNANVL
jgi:hypothetical protein